MDWDTIVARLKILAVIGLVMGGLAWWQIRGTDQAVQKALDKERESASPYAPPGAAASPGQPGRPGRMAKVTEALQAGRNDEALAQCRQILAAPQDAAEKDEAAKALPGIVGMAFAKAAKADDVAAAEALWRELAALREDLSRHSASYDLRSWAERAMAAGDTAKARKLMALVVLQPVRRDDIPCISLAKKWQERLLKERDAAKAAGRQEEAEALLSEAAEIDPWEELPARALAGTPAAELAASARRLIEAKKFAAALAYLNAAWESRDSGAEQEAIRNLRNDCWWGLALQAEEAGRIDGILLNSAFLFFERVEGPRERDARGRIALLIEKSADQAAAAKDFAKAYALFDRASEAFRDAWNRRARGSPPDVWTGVEPETAEKLQSQHAGEPEQADALNAILSDSPPEKSPLLDCRRIALKREALNLDWGIAELPDNEESALRRLRRALRAQKDAVTRARVDIAVREAFSAAAAKNDFNRIVDLAAFALAELGAPRKGDPFRAKLMGTLEAAAKELEARSPNRRVFILTLLAEAFPDEPAGASAGEAAVGQGLKLFEGVNPSQGGGRPLGPSGLQGLSVVSVENGTEHHILIFYDGPERFFLRVNPYRRASAVLRDGAYAIGVMASDDSVVPYRGRVSYSGQRLLHRYVLEERGSGASERKYAAPASGDWLLLRAPKGAAGMAVDPGTGEVRPARSPNPL